MRIEIPNIRHLAALAATVRHGTVTEAAREIALTQPALTQAIANLERRLDCTLFDREPGGMRPTEPALLLAPRAKVALELIGSPRVTSTQMRAFIAIARNGSYTAASSDIGIAPASLHRAVADLSVALGERLVERRGKYLALTKKGEKRARDFGLALAELRSGLAEVSAWLGKAGERMVIGAMPLSRARWLPGAIARFITANPIVEIAVIEGSYAELAGSLRDGSVDFLLGALRDEGHDEAFEQEPSFVDRPQIIMRSGHPLERAGTSTPDELGRFPWALPARQTPLRQYWEDNLAGGSEGEPNVPVECGSVLTIRELLIETDFLTLLSPDQVRVEIEAGMLETCAPPREIRRTIGITVRKNWRPTKAQRAMLEILREDAKQIS